LCWTQHEQHLCPPLPPSPPPPLMSSRRLSRIGQQLADVTAEVVPVAADDDELLFGAGSETTDLQEHELRTALKATLDKLGPRERVLILPPDFTRAHSQAGIVTKLIYEYYGDKVKDILPALGSHDPVSVPQSDKMFAGVPPELFRVHDWRNDVKTLGTVPGEFVGQITGGRYSHEYPVQLNKLVVDGGHDLIISVGQVVPHEVAGMANHSKNMLVGCGGKEAIDQSHFVGAVYGMENIMGRYDNPVRKLYNKAWSDYCSHLPVCWMQTVCAKDEASDKLAIRGFYTGMGYAPFVAAAELALKVNFEILDEEITKAVVYLDPEEFHTTWLGNKAIYRTRMAMATGGELVVLAPGVERFGEDMGIDALLRKYGYRPSEEIVKAVAENDDLRENLSAAAHLMHGSPEGRFTVKYCPGHMTKEEIEGVGFDYGDLAEMSSKYDISTLTDGFNDVNGERVFFVSNPALGLWSHRSRFA